MAIRVVFPAEKSTITAPSLHQWDYGQTLEIESADLLPIVEVHFACSGMTEAIVRPCSVNNGIATVPIPDICLEQAGPISAWVFEINGTVGMTRKTITIPVVGRIKPAPGGDIPTEVYDRYTELITELNEAIKALTEGNVTAAQAKNANYAAEANHANSASYADAATFATRAGEASSAGRAGRLSISSTTSKNITETGLYIVEWENGDGNTETTLIFINDLDSDVCGAGSSDGGTIKGPSYGAYNRHIFVPSGSILAVWKIADYNLSVG